MTVTFTALTCLKISSFSLLGLPCLMRLRYLTQRECSRPTRTNVSPSRFLDAQGPSSEERHKENVQHLEGKNKLIDVYNENALNSLQHSSLERDEQLPTTFSALQRLALSGLLCVIRSIASRYAFSKCPPLCRSTSDWYVLCYAPGAT